MNRQKVPVSAKNYHPCVTVAQQSLLIQVSIQSRNSADPGQLFTGRNQHERIIVDPLGLLAGVEREPRGGRAI